MTSIAPSTASPAGSSTPEPRPTLSTVDAPDMASIQQTLGQLNLQELSLTQKLAYALSLTQLYVELIDLPLLTRRQRLAARDAQVAAIVADAGSDAAAGPSGAATAHLERPGRHGRGPSGDPRAV